MDRTAWNMLSKEGQKLWETLSEHDKRIILDARPDDTATGNNTAHATASADWSQRLSFKRMTEWYTIERVKKLALIGALILVVLQNMASSAERIVETGENSGRAIKTNASVQFESINNVDAPVTKVPDPLEYNITAAVCSKTLFGNVNLYQVIHWVDYNQRLGFDHHFIWYPPSLVDYPGFQELNNTPDVTLVLNLNKDVEFFRPGYAPDQMRTQRWCVNGTQENPYASTYDYVMVADSDEYFWFNQNTSVKHFLQKNTGTQLFSFGHFFYTTRYKVQLQPNECGLLEYPFTPGPWCGRERMRKQNGGTWCPGPLGACKWIITPKYYRAVYNNQGLRIHAGVTELHRKEANHFSTETAHFRHYKGVYNLESAEEMRHRADLVAPNASAIGFDQFKQVYDKEVPLKFDRDLIDWCDYLYQNGAEPYRLKYHTGQERNAF